MDRDKLDKGLREKLGDTRIQPPPYMWERISATLAQQGLTAANRPPVRNTRRIRRVRLVYAAAAAVLLIAAVLVIGPNRMETDNRLAVGENPGVEQPQPATADPTGNPAPDAMPAISLSAMDGSGAPARRATETGVIMAQPRLPHDEYMGGGNEKLVASAATEKNEIGKQTDVEQYPEAVNVVDALGNSGKQWADVGEIERILKGSGKGKRKATSVGLYSANIGSRSSEKVMTSTPYARASSDFVIMETTNFSSTSYKTSTTVLKHRVPLSVGLSITKGLTERIYVESGLTYSYLVSKGENALSGGGNRIKKRELHYVGIPVGLKYDMIRGGVLDIYGSVSGLFEICVQSRDTKQVIINGVSSEAEIESLNVRGIQPSIGAHLGAEVKLARKLGIFAEPGVNYYFDMKKQPESYRTENPLNFSLKVGLRLNFN